MNESKKYTAFSIPPRENQPANDITPLTQNGYANALLLTDTEFAEIEFELNISSIEADDAKRYYVSSAAPAQQIGKITIDPIRQKFYDMRSLASGNPIARYDSDLFYRQAKFMEDFSDDYSDCDQFFMYFPCYQHMGYEQLRTYFTWRAKIRCGETPRISLSYIFLYIYELLSNIGVNSPVEGLDKLMTIWNAYREHEPALDNYLPGWLKDYHIYYELPHSLKDFIYKHNLQRFYSDLFLLDADPENAITLWNCISGYDITKSKFYKEGNDVQLRDCFYAVLNSVHALCEGRNIRVEELLLSSVCNGASWFPFQRALFHQWVKQPDRQVKMSGQEIYYCKDNRWTANITMPYSDRKELVGYLIKKMEACLRQAVKYKFKINASPGAIDQKLKKHGIPRSELDKVIEKTVADFHKNTTQIVVSVDYGNLARIRKEALGTQDKLIIPDDNISPASFVIPAEQIMPSLPEPQNEMSVPASDGWASLKDALSATELKTLSMVLLGDTGVKAFADHNGVMLEVLADSINEKAADCIGDSILEMDDYMTIYGEYADKIAEMVG